MEETPATIDRRYHDAVIFGLDGVMTDTVGSLIALVHRLREIGITTASCVAAQNSEQILRAVGELFDVRVNGVTAETPELPGRPDPAALLQAAGRLGVRPDRCVVIAGAEPVIHAADDSGFALVIGVDRIGHDQTLRSMGADVVVTDLAEVTAQKGGAPIAILPDALHVHGQIKDLLVDRQAVVLVDFDRTLFDVADDAASPSLIAGAVDALRTLAGRCPVVLCSDQAVNDIRDRVGVAELWFFDSAGSVLVAPDGKRYRETPNGDSVGRLPRSSPKRRTSVGRGEGRTLRWMLAKVTSSYPETTTWLPVYIGAGLTAEAAFDVVSFNGIGIVVRDDTAGERLTAAMFSVRGSATVCELTRQLASDLAGETTHSDPSWLLTFNGYDADHEKLREALCTVANGYVGVRGCAPESMADSTHYPGTYAAGVYNRLTDHAAGHTFVNESLVNLPNWLSLTFRIDGGVWFDVGRVDLLEYSQVLDLRRATLTRRLRFRDADGRITALTQQRFASMDQPNVVALQTTIFAANWSGPIEFRSTVDADVHNDLVGRYHALSGTHLIAPQLTELPPDAILVRTKTSQSDVSVAMAVRSVVWRNESRVNARYRLVERPARYGHDIEVVLAAGQTVTLEKTATIFTSRDAAISEPAGQAEHCLNALGGYADLRLDHTRAWAQLWSHFDIELGDNSRLLPAIRLHILHMLQTVSSHIIDLDVGVPARGLHGEAYRGHIFWDELFIIPVLNLRLPILSRSLLDYRYRRLPEARRAARRAGHVGAMYPWQSASDGREVSAQLHLNPRSGRWHPDPSGRAHHVGLAVAYNVWNYYQATGDRDFLRDRGAEMLVEIARFWAGLASLDDTGNRYVIRGVIGPDEFHSGYPGRQYDGIDNNAYTNVMAVWVIMRALEALEILRLQDRLGLVEKVGLTAQERDHWDDLSHRMIVPFHDGVISQFEGYSELAELDWESYRWRYGNIQRLDRILEAENDSVNNYKASKQADVLMLFYLLSAEELLGIFGRLGYRFRPEQIPRTVNYYLARTSHGSSLSAVVHSWVLARANRHDALDYFERVLSSDIADIQGGTTEEGIHLGAMVGTVDLVQRCFTGLEMRDNRLIINPHWPEPLGALEFPFTYRGHRLRLRISGRGGDLTAEPGNAEPIALECHGLLCHVAPGQTVKFN